MTSPIRRIWRPTPTEHDFKSSGSGVANRVMVGYKSAESDPVKGSTATVLWRDPLANRPEQSLVGVQSTAHLKNEGAGAVYVQPLELRAGEGRSDGRPHPTGDRQRAQ